MNAAELRTGRCSCPSFFAPSETTAAEEKKECKFRTCERNAPGRSGVEGNPLSVSQGVPARRCPSPFNASAKMHGHSQMVPEVDDAKEDGLSCERIGAVSGDRTVRGGKQNGLEELRYFARRD